MYKGSLVCRVEETTGEEVQAQVSSKPEIDVAGMTGVPGAAGTGSVGDNQQDMSFADMLSQLEEIVNRLESGELSLEESR